MKGLSLTDYLAFRMRAEYLSDLRMKPLRKERPVYLLDTEIALTDFPEADWIEACAYLTGEICGTGNEARQRLYRFCKGQNGHD